MFHGRQKCPTRSTSQRTLGLWLCARWDDISEGEFTRHVGTHAASMGSGVHTARFKLQSHTSPGVSWGLFLSPLMSHFFICITDENHTYLRDCRGNGIK